MSVTIKRRYDVSIRLPLVKFAITHCFLRNSKQRARERPKACMLQVKVLKRRDKIQRKKKNTIEKYHDIDRILMLTLIARKQYWLEIFYLLPQSLPDLKILASVVPALRLFHIARHRKKLRSKTSLMSRLVERVNACKDIHDTVPSLVPRLIENKTTFNCS